jgi:23S rRNA G2445 N2-methylase RlmL
MKDKRGRHRDKQLYQDWRRLSFERLWLEEVPRFETANAAERMRQVALVRAVGVAVAESGDEPQKSAARAWFRRLLKDPSEKIRRYAMAALPKVGAGPSEEEELLSLWQITSSDREKRYLAQTLEKIGGAATLGKINAAADGGLSVVRQKIEASLARRQNPSTIRMDRVLTKLEGLQIQLHCRRGLEQILGAEVTESAHRGRFKVTSVRPGTVALQAMGPFTLGDIYSFRCFATAGFVLGTEVQSVDAMAEVITSPRSRRLLETFTEGSIRYRLDFVSKGHQRGLVRLVARKAYATCPSILNDASSARWVITMAATPRGNTVELCPKPSPDPRFVYRQADIPAASHPPLAAASARLAGYAENEIVWDPFCGSGLELAERVLLGGVRRVIGTDVSRAAVEIAQRNFARANTIGVESEFVCRDFHNLTAIPGLRPGTVTLVITNPPMGRRIPVPDLEQLIRDLFRVAAVVLKPGGRLVLVSPLRLDSTEPRLKREFRQGIDLGGFSGRLEKYVKID